MTEPHHVVREQRHPYSGFLRPAEAFSRRAASWAELKAARAPRESGQYGNEWFVLACELC